MDTVVLSDEFQLLTGLFLRVHSKIMNLPWSIMTNGDLQIASKQIDLLTNYKCILFHNTDAQLDEECGRQNIEKQWTAARTQILIHLNDKQDRKIKIDTHDIREELRTLQSSSMKIIEAAATVRIPESLRMKILVYKLLQKTIMLRCSLFHYNVQALTRPHAQAEKFFERIYFRLHQLAMYFAK